MATVNVYSTDRVDELLGDKADVTDLNDKADLVAGKLDETQVPNNVVLKGDEVIDARSYLSMGSDTLAIQAALAAATPGTTVYLGPRIWQTTAPITIPPQVRLLGSLGGHIDNVTNALIKPTAAFAGEAVVMLVDQATGGYSQASNEQRIENLSIDCVNIPGTTIHGILSKGFVHGVYITDVQVRNPPNHGLEVVSNASGGAYSWHVLRLHVSSGRGTGINAAMTDSTWIDCEAIGCAGHGWFVGGAANSAFIGCRSEWSGLDGFNLGSGTGNGQGSGGPTFTACTTDRNGQNGVSIPIGANGVAPVTFTGCHFRRDGRYSTTSGYAGMNIVSTTQPIVLNGCTTYPGTNDDGTGLSTPQYGLSVTGAKLVQVNGGSWHGAQAGIFDGGGGSRIQRSLNVIERVGPTNAPVEIVRGLQTYGSYGGSLDVPDGLAGMAQPRTHELVAWTCDPALVSSGKVGVAGTQYLSLIQINRPATLSKICWGINTTASGVVSGQNWISLFDQNGTLLRSIGVDARLTTTGAWAETIADLAVTPGNYWVGFLFNCTTTMPAVYRAGDLSATLLNINSISSNRRFATNGTGKTVPGNITVSSNAAAQFSYWAAVG